MRRAEARLALTECIAKASSGYPDGRRLHGARVACRNRLQRDGTDPELADSCAVAAIVVAQAIRHAERRARNRMMLSSFARTGVMHTGWQAAPICFGRVFAGGGDS